MLKHVRFEIFGHIEGKIALNIRFVFSLHFHSSESIALITLGTKFTPAFTKKIIVTTADLPELFNGSQETENCLGAALQAAYKMVKFIKIKIVIIVVHHDLQVNPTGGRITVVQGSLPNIGPGAVENREAGAGEKVWLSLHPSLVLRSFSTSLPTALSSSSCLSIQSQTEMVKLLNPSTDFYKRLALECNGQQIAVDLFVIARWVKTEDNCWQN